MIQRGYGGVSEWSNEQSWKDCVPEMVPRVRISPPPQLQTLTHPVRFLFASGGGEIRTPGHNFSC